MPGRPVSLVGLGFISPIGNSAAEVSASLREGRSGLRPVDWFPGCAVKLAGAPEGFELGSRNQADWRWPETYDLPREVLRSLSPHGVYAWCAILQALADAGLAREALRDGRTGLFTASAGSPSWLRHHLDEAAASGGARVHPWGVVRTIAGTLSFNFAAQLGVRGPVTGFVSACAASAHALGYACDEIMLGRQDRMLVVGAEEPVWETLLPFAGMRALSRHAEPRLASRPFDKDRDGFVGSGGAVALVLEATEAAAARGARAQARVLGWGQSADGHSMAQPDPEGDGLARAMRSALAAARLEPRDIDYVNAHATSTPAGDRAEALALRAVFGSHPVVVSSTKGLTGHPLSMSGALEAGICALALREGFMPGNHHLAEPDEACAGLNLPRETLARAPRTVLSNSSGFGGSNVCLVLGAP